MKQTSRSPFTIITNIVLGVALLLAFGVVFFLYRFGLDQARSMNRLEWSASAEASAESGLLLGRYVPLTDSVRLGDGTALAVPSGWVERRWGYDVSPLFRETFAERGGHQLYFPSTESESDYEMLSAQGGDYATDYAVSPEEQGTSAMYIGYSQGLRRVPTLSVSPTWFEAPVDTLRVQVWEERTPGGGLGGAGDRVVSDTAVWVFRPVTPSGA